MDNDFSFTGFFHVEESKNVIHILTCPNIKDYKDIKCRGEWYYGDLFVQADGNYIEASIQKVYKVQYVWNDTSVGALNTREGLLFIDGEPFSETTGWFFNMFFKTSHSYYPDGTRFITDVTDDHSLQLRFFNHVVKLHTDTGEVK